MTREPLLAVPGVAIEGTWRGNRVRGSATLVLLEETWQLHDRGEARLTERYEDLTDATWEREALGLHRATDALSLRGPRELSRAWALVLERACALPEVARGLRMLGSPRGGSAALQQRFFGPLLAARRRLQEPEALERRATQFDAVALGQRLKGAIAEFAASRHPEDPPHRRSLEAWLEEGVEPLLAALDRLSESTEALHRAPGGGRFTEWRLWTDRLRAVFLEADRAWAHIISHLEPR